MPSPFPGMNPYLESPEFWREVHNRLIVATADTLEPQLSLNYRVAIEKRIYLSSSENAVGIPDVTVVSKKPANSQPNSSVTLLNRVEPTLVKLPIPETVEEGYLEIREMPDGRVITVIEILSPTNKRAGIGREIYEKKRLEMLNYRANLVEIDLQKLLLEIYHRARFDLEIDYNKEPVPPLKKQDREWADNILRQQKRR